MNIRISIMHQQKKILIHSEGILVHEFKQEKDSTKKVQEFLLNNGILLGSRALCHSDIFYSSINSREFKKLVDMK